MSPGGDGAGWEVALDALARRVDEQEATVASGLGALGEVAPFVAPVGLGPLPGALAPRAEALLARTGALEAQLEALGEQAGAELAALRRSRLRSPDAPAPAFVDRAL